MKHLITIVLLLLAGSTCAAPHDDAFDAHARGDFAAELKITRPLATKGEAWAQSNLGGMYVNGQGVLQDYAEAVKWFKLAAAQGSEMAQYNLGRMYAIGQGVPIDYVRAHMWFNLVAVKSTGGKNRDIVAKKMTAQQIAEAQKLARECQGRNFEGC